MTSITYTRVGEIALLTLDRPSALNAISGRTISDLNEALDKIEADECIALVVTGAGRAFCAGADLKEQAVDPAERIEAMHKLALRLTYFPKISVAALNGLAFGGGLELAMACTFRVAAPGAHFALPEAKVLKALPGYGGTQLLPRLVGRTHALEMLLTGDAISAQRAEAIGLINEIAQDCVERSIALAQRAGISGLRTVNLIRGVVDEGLATDLEAGLQLEAEAARQVSQSDATRAALASFSADGSASLKR